MLERWAEGFEGSNASRDAESGPMGWRRGPPATGTSSFDGWRRDITVDEGAAGRIIRGARWAMSSMNGRTHPRHRRAAIWPRDRRAVGWRPGGDTSRPSTGQGNMPTRSRARR